MEVEGCGDVIIFTIVAMTPFCEKRKQCHFVRYYITSSFFVVLSAAVSTHGRAQVSSGSSSSSSSIYSIWCS